MSAIGPKGSPAHSRHARAPKITREMIQGNNGFLVSESDRAYAKTYFKQHPRQSMILPGEEYEALPNFTLAGKHFHQGVYALKDSQGNIYGLHTEAVLGGGCFGTVFVCQVIHSESGDVPMGKYYAVKTQYIEKPEDLSAYQRENAIARHHGLVVAEILDHPLQPDMIATVMPILPGKDLNNHFPGYFTNEPSSSSDGSSSFDLIDLFRDENRRHSGSTGSYSSATSSLHSGSGSTETSPRKVDASSNAAALLDQAIAQATFAQSRAAEKVTVQMTQDIDLFPIEFVLHTFAKMDGALAIVHALGTLHLDFKPENIKADLEDDVFQVFDFGLSKRMDEPPLPPPCQYQKGTPAYMAPEYFDDSYTESVSTAQDTYASARAKELLILNILSPLFDEAIYEERPPTDLIPLPDVFMSSHLRHIEIENPTNDPKIWALNQFLNIIYAQKADKPSVRLSVGEAQLQQNDILTKLRQKLADRITLVNMCAKIDPSLSPLQQLVKMNQLIEEYNQTALEKFDKVELAEFNTLYQQWVKCHGDKENAEKIHTKSGSSESETPFAASPLQTQYHDDLSIHEQLLLEIRNAENGIRDLTSARPSGITNEMWLVNRRAVLSRVEARILRYEHDNNISPSFLVKRMNDVLTRFATHYQQGEGPQTLEGLTLLYERHQALSPRLNLASISAKEQANSFKVALQGIRENNDSARKHGPRTKLKVKCGQTLDNDGLNAILDSLIIQCENIVVYAGFEAQADTFKKLASLVEKARQDNFSFYKDVVDFPRASSLFKACKKVHLPCDIHAEEVLYHHSPRKIHGKRG